MMSGSCHADHVEAWKGCVVCGGVWDRWWMRMDLELFTFIASNTINKAQGGNVASTIHTDN